MLDLELIEEYNGINKEELITYVIVSKLDNLVIGKVIIENIVVNSMSIQKGNVSIILKDNIESNECIGKVLDLVYNKCLEMNMISILVNCSKNNKSLKTILLKKSAKFVYEYKDDNSNIVEVYWCSLKKRFANSSRNGNILNSKYVNLRVDDTDFNGNISLLKIEEVKKPWIVNDFNRDDKILDLGYYWLEIYKDNANFAITSIYNENEEIVEWYFDIAREVGEENGIPYEDDFFLDVVLKNDGKVLLLDEDDLQDVYVSKKITKEEYDMAYLVANRIYKEAPKKLKSLKSFTDKYLLILKEKLKASIKEIEK